MGSIPTRSRHFAGAAARAAAVLVAATVLLGTAQPQAPVAEADASAVDRRAGRFDSPGWVMLRSALVPGWGQAENGKWLKAVLVAAGEAAILERLVFEVDRIDHYRERADALPEGEDAKRSYYEAKVERHRMHRRDYFWWLGLAIGLSMGDAYVDAQLRDYDVELQVEPEEDVGAAVRLSISHRF